MSLLKPILTFSVFALLAVPSVHAQVVCTGGATSEDFSCTIGDAFVGNNVGMLATAVQVVAGVESVWKDEALQVENHGQGQLTIKALGSALSDVAHYSIYSLDGTLIDRQSINDATTSVDYAKFSPRILILTIDTASKGCIATFKIVR